MALHPDFPEDPHAILDPEIRWFPADETLRATSYEKLLPPFVPQLRRAVRDWRNGAYAGATDTSRSLLNWWFNTPHLIEKANGAAAEFQYYFAQREALETVIYLYDVVGVRDKFDLMRFDSSGAVSTGMFDETWRRFVIKMATGTGKTKVMSLLLAWSFYHKLYEPDSELARNFLVIAPNIIVLDRIYKDFAGLRIFFEDPVLPDNGTDGRDWRNDFQLTLHVQDDVRITHPTGNIFLTNIHRVYAGDDDAPSADDDDLMRLLPRPAAGSGHDRQQGRSGRHRPRHQRTGRAQRRGPPHPRPAHGLVQIHRGHPQPAEAERGVAVAAGGRDGHAQAQQRAIFVQTVSDYPLVEAITQNVVKHPVLPDAASRAKLLERKSAKYTEKYADYINLGVIEWRKAYAEHEKLGKKAILFVMTDDTKNCDEVAAYLEGTYPELKDAVLVIHTKNNGEISEAQSGKNKEELERLRREANEIDGPDSPYKAIISVMVLKEGWDVRNVTTIVGLRAYSSKSNILPEQTLGRGLRKMYPGSVEEYVSVVGTDAFMDFVESIQNEGITLERKPMGEGTGPKTPLVVEIDRENMKKDLDKLDIEIPVLSPRIYREYKNLAELDVTKSSYQRVIYRQFSEEEQRAIVFRDITTGEVTHTTYLDTFGIADYNSVIRYFTQTIAHDLRLVSGQDVLYGKVKAFVRDELFGRDGGTGRRQHPAQPVGSGSDADDHRDVQAGDQRANRQRPGRRGDTRSYQAARDAAVRRQGSGLHRAQEEHFQPHRRRQPSRVAVCQLPG